MENILIKFIGLFRKVYESAGINFDHLQAIVRIKLIMDNRRNSASFFQGYGQSQKKESNFKFLLLLGIYAFLGGVTSIFFSIDGFFGIAIIHSFIMTFLALTLVSDYSSVLLDTADNTILMPRPIDSKTIFAARLTHISLYVGLITLSMSTVPFIVAIVKFGLLGGVIFLVTAILMGIFAVFFTSLIYLLLFRFTTEERLKDVINYVQIGLAVFFYGFSQLFPRIFDLKDFNDSVLEQQWWHYLLPPMWMTAPLDAYLTHTFDLHHLILMVECLFMPIVGLWVVNRYFAPYFNQKLAVLSNDTEGGKISQTENEKGASNSLISRIATFITKSPVEQGAFNFVWYQLGRDRKLKLRLYPQLSYVFVILFMLMLSYKNDNSFWEAVQEASESKIYLVCIYLITSMMLTAMAMISYSDDYKAAWIYYALPILKPGEVLLGAHKAMLMRFMLPGSFIISILVLSVWGIKVIPDLIFGYLNVIILSIFVALESKMFFPFSEAVSGQTDSGNASMGFLNLFFSSIAAGIHFGLTYVPYVIWALIPVQYFLIKYLMTRYRNVPDRKISSVYE